MPSTSQRCSDPVIPLFPGILLILAVASPESAALGGLILLWQPASLPAITGFQTEEFPVHLFADLNYRLLSGGTGFSRGL